MITEQLVFGFEPRLLIGICFAMWFIAGIVVFAYCRRRPSAGVPLAYLSVLTVLHLGALIYLLPWYDPATDPYLQQQGANLAETCIGLVISTLGTIAFGVGVLSADQIFKPRISRLQIAVTAPIKFGKWIIAIGAAFFFVITPFANRIPSGAAIASAGVNLSIVGICLYSYGSLRLSRGKQVQALIATLSVPSITIVFMGFVGYGVTAVTEIGSFVTRFLRIRWWAIPLGFVFFWLALSFYVTYMTGRIEIREKVWGRASLVDRITTIGERFADAQLFNPYNVKHLYLIDSRINQNTLVGRCYSYLDRGNELANGESIRIALIAWIPRVLWPGKPTIGGSGDFASRYTGMKFDSDTSVGVGLVMEMFANFGWWGVAIGFWVLGILLRYIDHSAAINLSAGQYWDFCKHLLIGFAMIQPGGFLAETVASAAAAIILVTALKQALIRQPMFAK